MPEKIVLSGPPAVGKSTMAREIRTLIPGSLSFDFESIRSEDIQKRLFDDILAHASFEQHFFLSPALVRVEHVLGITGWNCALLLPRNKEHYYAAVKLRAKKDWGKDDDEQKYRDHYKHYSGIADDFRDDPRVIRIDRLNEDGSERDISDTVAELVRRFHLNSR